MAAVEGLLQCCHVVCPCVHRDAGLLGVAWASFWEKPAERNLAFFRLKRLQPMMKGMCAAGAGWIVLTFFSCHSGTVASSCFGCVCVCAVLG